MKHILTGLAFGLFLLAASFAFGSGGPTRPVFFLPHHTTLENRDLIRETRDGRELTVYLGRCYRVVRWDSHTRETVPSGTMKKVIRLMDSAPPTETQWKNCAKEFKAGGWVTWVVDRYRLSETRPIYEWANGKRGRKIGDVRHGTECERRRLARSSWGRQWRYTTNEDGARGAAVCERTE